MSQANRGGPYRDKKGKYGAIFCPISVAFLVGSLLFSLLRADETICASCQLQIDQQVTFERQGFTGTMTVANGLPDDLEGVEVNIYFTDASGNPAPATDVPGDLSLHNTDKFLFFYTPIPNEVNTGTIAGKATVKFGWTIIPTAWATDGVTDPKGVEYYVGATLKYTAGGQIQSVKVTPDYIFVLPQPQIALDYFLPSHVDSQDPTVTGGVITPPVPFNLGVRVSNTGNGPANNLQIDSGQPQVIQNTQHLAIQFKLTGASVNDAVVTPTLLANFGTIASGQTSVARWVMTSSLSGQLTFTGASYTHADALGGSLTSLLSTPSTHALIHDVLVDLPGRDNVRDFLAASNADGSGDMHVFESQSRSNDTATVHDYSSSFDTLALQSGTTYQLPKKSGTGTLDPGFLYIQQPVSESFANHAVTHATRGDGKQINANNIWFSRTLDDAHWSYFFNLFDVGNPNALDYSISFGGIVLPPVFAPLADQTVNAGDTCQFNVTATDPDGTTPVITSQALPVGAVLDASSGGTAHFHWATTSGQGGNFSVTFVASEGSLTTTKTITITVGTGSKLQNWKMKYFGRTDIADNADYAGDGLSVLLKYALDFDPTKQSPNSGILIGTLHDETSGHTYLTLTYVVRTDDSNLTYTVIGANSPSLPDGEWETETAHEITTVSQDGVPANMHRYEFRDSQPIDTGLDSTLPRRFLRLRVTNTGAN